MQLAKVVIASVLVFAACAEGMPEGKHCVLKSTPHKFFFKTAHPDCYTEVDSMNFNVLTVCTGNE